MLYYSLTIKQVNQKLTSDVFNFQILKRGFSVYLYFILL